MFNNKPYYQVNREERHFGFLFASALIHNKEFRKKIFEAYNKEVGSALVHEDGQFDIYLEVAALRDYWNDLYEKEGMGKTDYQKADGQKKKILDKLIEGKYLDPIILSREDIFRTPPNQNRKGYIWFPGQWNAQKLLELENDPQHKGKLISIRWAFNAKPDILIVSGKSALIIEVKLESSEGKKDTGYNQLDTQRLIAKLMSELVPEYIGVDILCASLAPKKFIGTPDNKFDGLSWSEVIDILSATTGMDPGSQYLLKCLNELKRFHPKEREEQS
jgi:hypothetical protein